MVKRILGAVIAVTAMLGIVIGIVAIVMGRVWVDTVGDSADAFVSTLAKQIETTTITGKLLQSSLIETNQTLIAVEQGVLHTASALTTTQTVLTQTAIVVGQDVPQIVGTLQKTLPNLISVASQVDRAMLILSQFRVDQPLLGNVITTPDIDLGYTIIPIPDITLPEVRLNFDLGITYNSEQAFDQSLIGIEQNLLGVPERLQGVGSGLSSTSADLSQTSADLLQIGRELNQLNTNLSRLPLQIDSYVQALGQTESDLFSAQTQLHRQLKPLKLGITLLGCWFVLAQMAPFYVGIKLFLKR